MGCGGFGVLALLVCFLSSLSSLTANEFGLKRNVPLGRRRISNALTLELRIILAFFIMMHSN